METYTTDCIHYQICTPTCTRKCQLYEKARPQGEWILIKNSDEVLKCYECSECKKCQGHISNFCEDCGAKMYKEDNNGLL